MRHVGIIGGGAWGTALAVVARRAGRDVTLWAREPEVIAVINGQNRNPLYLPDVALDPAITATSDMMKVAKPTSSCWWCPPSICAASARPSAPI